MTNFVHDIDLTINDKFVWRPAKGKDHLYKYAVQYAPSNRARCRKCSQNVEKGELRMGIPIKHPGGEFGWISAWQHLSCTRIDEREGYEDIIYGYSGLSQEVQGRVVEAVTSTEIPEHLRALDPDDLVKRGRLDEVAEPPTLLRPLLPYQKEGLGWMVQQERQSDVKGGILADEMGMGKTIQIISLLLAHRVSGPTLVVSPVSSMLQWETEIKEHVVPGTLSVLVVYRTTKVTREQMENADVVLTTYPMIEQAWRALVNRIKVPCPYCGLLFIPRQLAVHNRYFCGPRAKKTMKQAKREKHAAAAATAVAPSNTAAPVNSRKVQSAATIRKGLRTLHVEVEDEEDTGKAGVSAEKPKGGSDKGDNASPATPADEEKKRPIMGPIAMYQELMREAGRTVRSRWDPIRRRQGRGSDSSSTSTASSDDDDGDEESDTSSSTSYDSAAEEAEAAGEAAREEKAKDRLAAFCCQQCHFQVLRYPFCPKTGQHHVLNDEMEQVIETDTGGDEVDLAASPFHSIKWARIVLDEAHRIKGRTTSTARSAFALEAEYHWCLTGTPLQNRVGDLYSLLRFLRVKPYSRYYCLTEGCSCSSLSHPFSGTSLRQCVFCGHGPLQHYAYFNRYVLNPINRYGYIGEGRKAMLLLSNDVFSKVMLRRTKAERAADLHLPPMEINVRKITLTKEERNFYESLYKKSTAEFDTFVSKGTVLHNYAHIFQLLSRLRQALDHPLLVVQGMNAGPVVHAKGLCGICGEGIEGENSIRTNPCRHQFHRLCLSQFLESAPDQEYHCPTCFVRINVDLRQLRADWDEDDDAGAAALPPELEEEMNGTEEGGAGRGTTKRGGGGGGGNNNGVKSKKPHSPVVKGEDSLNASPVKSEPRGEDGEDATSSPTAKRGKRGRSSGSSAAAAAATGGGSGGGGRRRRAAPVKTEEGHEDEEEEENESESNHSEAAAVEAPAKKVDRGILSRIDPTKPLHGTKLDAIADYIQSVPTEEKVIVFSQFGDMLDLTQYWLQRRFIKAVKLCGSLTLTQRQAVLQAFLHDPSVRVILISLKAGGEGLNLQVANHVVLTDPWWNPAVEMQAIQRAHRIGQSKPVHAVRFVTEDSVEERMVELQDKKMLVFEGTIDGKLQSLQKLSEEDLQFLFTG